VSANQASRSGLDLLQKSTLQPLVFLLGLVLGIKEVFTRLKVFRRDGSGT
jgi:hypothetical protein